MLNPSTWNWGAKAGFFWAASCFLCLVWTYFRLPEPKGRTQAELDFLFERKVSARKFPFAMADIFQPSDLRVILEKNEGVGRPWPSRPS
jgi:SP family general alpha glucoside:H+ symporter-like MFS transporter